MAFLALMVPLFYLFLRQNIFDKIYWSSAAALFFLPPCECQVYGGRRGCLDVAWIFFYSQKTFRDGEIKIN